MVKKDIVLAGNNSWTRIKFGRHDANYGMLFLGDGKGGFTYVPQWQSGLNLRGDVRSIQTITMGDRVQMLFGVNNSPVKAFYFNK